jgi:hypothetical protein
MIATSNRAFEFFPHERAFRDVGEDERQDHGQPTAGRETRIEVKPVSGRRIDLPRPAMKARDLKRKQRPRDCSDRSALAATNGSPPRTRRSRRRTMTRMNEMQREPSDHVAKALAFVERRGIVLASAKGDAPRLIETILGQPVSGNWWAHPQGNFVHNVLAAVSESDDVLVCRLLGGKVTLVHRRLWPALVRVADRFEPARLAKVREEHLPTGRHVAREVPFPSWVPSAVHEEAAVLGEEQAMTALGPAVAASLARSRRKARK